MRALLVLFFLLPSLLMAEDSILEAVSHPSLAQLKEAPAERPEIASIKMLVTTDSEVAQKHVRIGLNHLLGFWDFEAYRHFILAAEADPDCPMAYWGICVSLATPGPCYTSQRIAAFKRLRQLIEAGRGNAMEAQLAGALAALYAEGPRPAASLFSLTAEKHRAAVLPGILACMVLRDGYDSFGEAREGQQVAEDFLADIAGRHPDVPAVRFYQAAILESAPDPKPGLQFAESLLEIAPDYPPYQEIIGYFRFRSGDYAGACAAYQKAFSDYSSYYQAHQIPESLDPVMTRCGQWLASARLLNGEHEAALELARKLGAFKLNKKQAHHPGACLQLWRSRTLEARLHLALEDFEAAIKALPGPRDRSPLASESLAPAMWQHLRQYAEGRRACQQGNLKLAMRFLQELQKFSEQLSQSQKLSTRRGAGSEWLQASETFLQLQDELRAAIAEAKGGDNLDSARIWLMAASDKQMPAKLLDAPLLLLPPQAALARIERARERPEAAREALTSGLKRWPAHPKLQALQEPLSPKIENTGRAQPQKN